MSTSNGPNAEDDSAYAKILRVRLLENGGKWKDVAAYTSLIISFLALFIAGLSAWQAREHNRRSVQPNLSFTRDVRFDRDSLGLFLKGAGAGPAIVDQVKLTLNDQPLPGWFPVRIYLASKGIVSTQDPVITRLDRGDYILPKDEIELLKFAKTEVLDGGELSNFLENEFNVTVFYCSIYGEAHCAQSVGDRCEPTEAVKKGCSEWR